ncbi:MAG: pantoate--beta-alanine ligase, partial [Mariprofundaceae bacterium]
GCLVLVLLRACKEEYIRHALGAGIVIIIHSPTDLRRHLAASRGKDRIALVPTMGCLHEGHLSLIRKARSLADIVVLSIYVNPLQFGPNEDLDAYPRTFEADAALCEAEGVDVIFHPDNLYAAGTPLVSLHVEELDRCLCGAARPGHFDGVATVVAILFNIVQPEIAVFGEKDWQQLTIIRRMVECLQMPVEIIGSETVREADGLAMSSRNRYLGEAERSKAKHLNRALAAMQNLAASGESDAQTLLKAAGDTLAEQEITPEYLEIRDAYTLQPIRILQQDHPARAFIAARIGAARLIDNISLALPVEPSSLIESTQPQEVVPCN